MQTITGPDGKVHRRRRKKKVVDDNAVSAEALAETFAAAMGLDFTGNAGTANNQEDPETGGDDVGGGGSPGQQAVSLQDTGVPKDQKKSWWGAKK